MRIGNLDGRLVILTDAGALDVERASGGRFASDPQAVYQSWAEFTAWAVAADHAGTQPYDPARLGAPAPAPRQAFGIGLNYRDHAAEAGMEVPDQLSVFTKFASCLTGPYTEVALPPGGTPTGRWSWSRSSAPGRGRPPRPTAGATWPG